MNYSKATVYFILCTLLVLAVQSKAVNQQSDKAAVRDKRWTFNTWRLHGRRQASNGLNFEKAVPAFSDDHPQDDVFQTEDDIGQAIHERLSQFFRGYHRQ